MGMVTVTDMASMEIRKTARIIVLTTILTVFHVSAEDTKFGVTASSELTYSDNIDLSEDDERSGVVSTWSAGAYSDIQGNDGNLFLKYDIYQTIHSVDSNRNELFNELAFSADKHLYRNNIKIYTDASITNIARSIEDNANADIITGDTIETRNLNLGLSYQSNPRGIVDVYSAISGSVTSNEDDIGDFYSFGTDLLIRNGSSVKNVLWLTDYSFNKNISGNSDNQYYDFRLTQEVGLKSETHISPLIRVYYEGYTEEGEDKLIESGSWGPAVRYYWHDRSYIELGYDFSFKEEDFWRGSLVLNPTPRTLFEFDYTKRFYGDSYYFSLSHKNKRVTNSIEYSEEVVGFNRRFFVVGDNIEEYRLVKGLNLNSTLDLKRTSFSFEISLLDRKPLSDGNLSDTGESKIYGTKISASHQLTRNTSLSGGFQYDKDVFNSISKTNYYRVYDVSLNSQFSKSLSWDFSLEHTNSSLYNENRANILLDLMY